ncbi:hypothetical protein DEU56DRAFT_813938 [Suillus clintonianus]|uniref:uncharacterized protein n=1 Tax=Suillus clintonianus TaxID=1904413 RepID=UPI001B8657DC|nr:uncharacterized protein DEU56DRAFT_813938 [Suillus clintonianus]KAG2131315.1 hypothetical protein DEU56DRAFT_813938 [Suillus clintonianus]
MISATLLSQLPQGVQSLVQSVSNRSVAGFEQLCNRLVDCSAHQMCILQPVFYMHLDPDCVPAKSTPAATTDIKLAYNSLVAIVSTLGYIDGSSVVDSGSKQYLLSAWNRVAPWLVFFHDQFIMRRANYRPFDRMSAIRLVASILFHVGVVEIHHAPSRNTVFATTPTLYRPIAELWLLALETKDEDVVCVSYQSFACITSIRVIGPLLVAQCMSESFRTILLEVSGGIGPFTSAALKYVKHIRSIAKEADIDCSALTPNLKMLGPMFMCSVTLIATTSRHSVAMREAYIIRQSVKEIFSTLRVLQPVLPCKMAGALGSSFPYFMFLLKHAVDPVSVLHQALRAHAFETIVRIDPSGPVEEAKTDPHNINGAFLGILHHHLVHDKILTYVSKHVDAWSDALGPIVREDENLWHFWSMLERRIRLYGMLKSKLKEEAIGWPSCEILQCYCGDSVEDVRLRQCAGCQVVRYCSKRCQRDSWYSHHRLSCYFLKAAVGSSMPHYVKRSLRLLAALEDSQLQRNWDNIRKLVVAAQCEFPKDRERLVVELALDKGNELVRPLRHYLFLFNGLSENEVVDRLSSWPDPRAHLRRSFCCLVVTIGDRFTSRQILFSPRTALDMETVSMLSRNC